MTNTLLFLAGVALAPQLTALTSIPETGQDIFPDALERLETKTPLPSEEYLEVRTVAVEGQDFKEALEAKTLKQPAWPWHVQLEAPVPFAVDDGDVILAEFWMRTVAAQAESGEGRTQLSFEQAGGNYRKSIAYDASAGSKWTRFQVPFRVVGKNGNGYAAGGSQVCFRLGYRPQTIQIGGIRFVNYGSSIDLEALPRTRFTYAGREPDAPWRTQAQARIEELRKAPLSVHVVDAVGDPVAGATVEVRMKRHAFSFGSAINLQYFVRKTSDGERYRQFVLDHYNQITPENDLKWNRWEREEDKRQNVIDALWTLAQADIRVHGHCLIWAGLRVMPPDLEGILANRQTLDKRILGHFEEILDETCGLVDEWDVVNEPYAERVIMNRYGDELVGEWFQTVHQIDPEPALYLNDYAGFGNGGDNTAHKDYFEALVRDLLARGVPVQGLGIQGHFGSLLCPPDAIGKELDRFGELGLPIQITEFDIDSMDDSLKADYTRDFLIACFSHPSVVGISTWGFWEGDHWKPSAALVRKDWTFTPWGQAWFDLVEKQWWTDVNGTTDDKGLFQTRGFMGDYEITVRVGDRETTVPAVLGKEQAPLVIEI